MYCTYIKGSKAITVAQLIILSPTQARRRFAFKPVPPSVILFAADVAKICSVRVSRKTACNVNVNSEEAD